MKFEDLLTDVAEEPVFETGFLLVGDRDPGDVRRQLSRWVGTKRLYQLRRGLYTLAPPHRKVRPHPFLVANHLLRGSYVSLQAALGHYGLIPEHVPVTTSVGPGSPGSWDTPLGRFEFRHLAAGLMGHYRQIEVGDGQWAFVATPEKALLDLVHLVPGADRLEYLRELRFQNLESLDLDALADVAAALGKPKLRRAAKIVAELAETEMEEYETL